MREEGVGSREMLVGFKMRVEGVWGGGGHIASFAPVHQLDIHLGFYCACVCVCVCVCVFVHMCIMLQKILWKV